MGARRCDARQGMCGVMSAQVSSADCSGWVRGSSACLPPELLPQAVQRAGGGSALTHPRSGPPPAPGRGSRSTRWSSRCTACSTHPHPPQCPSLAPQHDFPQGFKVQCAALDKRAHNGPHTASPDQQAKPGHPTCTCHLCAAPPNGSSSRAHLSQRRPTRPLMLQSSSLTCLSSSIQ